MPIILNYLYKLAIASNQDFTQSTASMSTYTRNSTPVRLVSDD